LMGLFPGSISLIMISLAPSLLVGFEKLMFIEIFLGRTPVQDICESLTRIDGDSKRFSWT
jgi:hypothetical protein